MVDLNQAPYPSYTVLVENMSEEVVIRVYKLIQRQFTGAQFANSVDINKFLYLNYKYELPYRWALLRRVHLERSGCGRLWHPSV